MNYIFGLFLIMQAPETPVPIQPEQSPAVKAISAQFMCPCGCGRVAVNCDCESAVKLQNEIADLVSQGFSKDEIINTYVRQYGESILAAPIKKGFNWTGYVMPFIIAVLTAGAIIYLISSQRKRSKTYTQRKPVKEKHKKKIEKELEDIE